MKTWLLILVSISISILLKFIFNNFLGSKKLPPGPLIFPIISNLLWFSTSMFKGEAMLRSLHAKFGPIVTLNIGARPFISMADRNLCHQALIRNGALYADRPEALPIDKIISRNQLAILYSRCGPTWRLLRRNLTAEILNPSAVKSYSRARHWVVQILQNRLESQAKSGRPVFVMEHFRYAMFLLETQLLIENGELEQKLDTAGMIEAELNKVKDTLIMEKKASIQSNEESLKITEDLRTLTDWLQEEKSATGKELEALKAELSITKQQLESAEQQVAVCVRNMKVTKEENESLTLKLSEISNDLEQAQNTIDGLISKSSNEETNEDHAEQQIEVMHDGVVEEGTIERTQLNTSEYETKIVLRKRWEELFRLLKCQEDELIPFTRERKKAKEKRSREPNMEDSKDESVLSYVDTLLDLQLPDENRKLNELEIFEWKAVDGDDVDLSEKQEFTMVMKNPLQAQLSLRSK
ncbi:hypothetical protein DKX38_027471 [Salix brachista]|uniref:Cytochrome P450 n=1 Tax=Salix brachista TaxID=2182728 RepID=A0A5N5JH67_9ROSI|nr:hypothetical protein DKX38_027471 [Salix brachista]